MSSFQFQVGGSLIGDAPSYVARQCDADFYQAIKRGEFCYVLNSRQMGKSSLLVQTRRQLQAEGYACAVVDMTNIGSENITPLQWYKGIVRDLWRNFKSLRSFNLNDWWQSVEELSLLQRLSRFLGDVLLPELPDQNIVIFLDEIDSILSLPFSVDDFFALVRYCYNQRAVEPAYHRLNFAIFGVANPSDLIRDRQRTPFNLGTAIALSGFTLTEAAHLTQGFEIQGGKAELVLEAILQWTSGQPFLTQKLCQLAISSRSQAVSGSLTIPAGTEAYWVEQLVHQHFLDNWEAQDEPEHLRTIRNRILSYSEASGRLLSLYQAILQAGAVPIDDSWEQTELLLSGLVVQDKGKLKVKNQIYAAVFNLSWVGTQLANLRPYAYALDAWVASGQTDESRLLRGQALLDAQHWSQGKHLSDLDYQFLSASVESDRHAVQQRLEAERLRAVEAELQQKRKLIRLQRKFLITNTIGLTLGIGLAIFAFWNYYQARTSERSAKISQIKALASSSQGNVNSHLQLEALIQAIQAQTELQHIHAPDPTLATNARDALRRSIYGIDEINRFVLNIGVNDVAVSPDGQWVAAAAMDGKVRLWSSQGELKRELVGHSAAATAVSFSPDGQFLVSASADTTLKIWQLDGTLMRTLIGHRTEIIAVHISPDSKQIVAIAEDETLRAWNHQGTFLFQIPGVSSFAYHPQNGQLFTVGRQAGIHIWRRNGQLLDTLPAVPTLTADSLAFSPDGSFFVQAVQGNSPAGQSLVLRRVDGRPLNTIRNMDFAGIRHLTISPNNQVIAVSGGDGSIRLWHRDGRLLHTFLGHTAATWGLAFHPDGKRLFSASEDGTIRTWQPQNPLITVLENDLPAMMQVAVNPQTHQVVVGTASRRLVIITPQDQGYPAHPIQVPNAHQGAIRGVAVSPDGRLIATGSRDNTIKLWSPTGKLLQTLEHTTQVEGVDFSPDGQMLAAATADGTIQLYEAQSLQGFSVYPVRVLDGHRAAVKRVAFSPDGRHIASASVDNTLKLWSAQGTSLATLKGHTAEVRDVDFHPSGNLIVSAAADNTIKLWNTQGQLLRTFSGHKGAVWSVAFSPDGQLIASSSMDGTIKVWQLDGTLTHTLKRHTAAVRSVAFSPDGQRLISGSDDRTVLDWNFAKINTLDELSYACEWVQDFLRISPHFQDERQSICQAPHQSPDHVSLPAGRSAAMGLAMNAGFGMQRR